MASSPDTLAKAAGISLVAAVIALGLSAGALLAEGAVLVPYWRSLTPEGFLGYYEENAARLFDFYGPLEIVAAVLAVVAAVLARIRSSTGVVPLVLAAILAVSVLVAFPLYFRDVNAGFSARTITAEGVGPELARWASWHWGRTALAVGAFAAAAFGALSTRPGA